MKKLLTVTLVMMFVLGLMGGVAVADDECPAAPDVAGEILEGFDVDFRYVSGTVDHPRHGEREVYANYIASVAGEMTNGAQFPAYDWYGEWDGETYVEKCDEEAYYQAVYNYLVGLGADIPKALSIELLEDISDGFVCQTFMTIGDNYPTVKVTDVHGNPVEGLDMRVSLPRVAEIGGPTPTDSDGIVVFDSLSYNEPGTYRANFYIADADARRWLAGTTMNALSNEFELRHDMIGSWINNSNPDRLVVIDNQDNGAFSGLMKTSTGTVLGAITGNVEGEEIEMLYDREGYDGGANYFAKYTGIMTDCDNAEGTRVHGNDGELRGEEGEPTDWIMER